MACALVVISVAASAQGSSVGAPYISAHGQQIQEASGDVAQKKQVGQEPRQEQTAVTVTDPVLTIRGVCSTAGTSSERSGGACTTVISRKEFEELMAIVAPGRKADAGTRQNVAKMYTELLALEAAARKAGIADTPELRWTLQVLRLRTLADSYRRNLEREYATPSSEEIDGYYHREARRFEEVKLRRIVLPKNNFSATDKQEFEEKALQVANELRQRAAKGEDFDGLQREGYTRLGFPGSPPSTEVGNRRRASLLSEVADEIFGLDPGQVSKVETEPYSFVIYKVDARRTLPQRVVRDEISKEIFRQKVDNAIKAVTGAVQADLNEGYFGTFSRQPRSAEPAATAPPDR
jgi:hypothetical protein